MRGGARGRGRRGSRLKTPAEIIASVRAAMERLDAETAQAAARANAYTGPERRRDRRMILGHPQAVDGQAPAGQASTETPL